MSASRAPMRLVTVARPTAVGRGAAPTSGAGTHRALTGAGWDVVPATVTGCADGAGWD